MADIVLNRALGAVAYYAGLPAASDALVMVPLESSGLVPDSVMRDYDTLADILAGASTEQTTAGRKTLANVTVTVDDVNDRVVLDCDDVTWTAATGNPIGAVIICYNPDTGSSTDTDLIPLTKHDVTWTPDGADFTLTIADWCRATSGA